MEQTPFGMVGAVVLAAGMSTRMGTPKMLLPWKDGTVVEQVVSTLILSGVNQICVVTGANNQEVDEILRDYPVNTAFNPHYQNGEMLYSIQTGLTQLTGMDAGLIVLGDQPQIKAEVVRAVIRNFRQRPTSLVIPSYQMRRGHPWLVAAPLWDEILSLTPPQTLRDFTGAHQEEITYLNVDTPSILQDMDTPEDYQRLKPAAE